MNSIISVLFVAIFVNVPIITQGIAIDRREIAHQNVPIPNDINILNSEINRQHADLTEVSIRTKRSERCFTIVGMTAGLAPMGGAILGAIAGWFCDSNTGCFNSPLKEHSFK